MLSIKDYYIEAINKILPTWKTDEVKAVYSVISEMQEERRKTYERKNHQAYRKNR